MKRWPLTLIKRGRRGSSNTIWWQETDDSVKTAAAARDIGYEAHDLVPVAYPERIASSAENLIRAHGLGGPNASPQVEDLQMVIDAYRDNVRIQKPE